MASLIFFLVGILDRESFLVTAAPGLHLLKETIIQSLRLEQDKPKSPRRIVLAGELPAYLGTEKVNFSNKHFFIK